MSEHDDAATRLALLNQPLTPATARKAAEFRQFAFGDQVPSTLTLEIDWGVGVGGGLWPAATLLLNQFSHRRSFFKSRVDGQRVLELGAGTGLLGLGACCLFEPAELVLSDLESHVALLKRNAEGNHALTKKQHISSASETVIRVEAYDWGEAGAAARLGGPFDVILGGDLAYNPEL